MIYLSNHHSATIKPLNVDLVFTDPPFEMDGGELLSIINRHDYKHLVLICSMHQALNLYKASDDLEFCLDFVISHISPKKAKSYQMPNMLHSNVVYFKKRGNKSVFDRRLVKRFDQYSDDANSHYYPSIFHSPKNNLSYKYQKNQNVINGLLGAFKAQTVLDPFAGSGTTGIAAIEHKRDCYLIEKDKTAFAIMKRNLSLFSQVEELP